MPFLWLTPQRSAPSRTSLDEAETRRASPQCPLLALEDAGRRGEQIGILMCPRDRVHMRRRGCDTRRVAVEDELLTMIDGRAGTWGVYARHLETGETVAIRAY